MQQNQKRKIGLQKNKLPNEEDMYKIENAKDVDHNMTSKQESKQAPPWSREGQYSAVEKEGEG
jgi:hypothetical protein